MKKTIILITSFLLVFVISMGLTMAFQKTEQTEINKPKQLQKQIEKNSIENIPETIIYENKLISKQLIVGWSPISPNIFLNFENISINIPNLDKEETNETENPIKPIPKPIIIRQKESEPKSGSTVEYGDIITYTITVGNRGTAGKKVIITDNIPENSEFVEVLDEGEEILEEEKVKSVKWEKTILPGEQIKLRFKVKVTGEVTKTINNTALVDGTPTNETVHKIVKTIEATSIKYTGKNIVLVLDLSSSMIDKAANGKIRLDVLKSSAKAFIDTTLSNENNSISLITFNFDTKQNAIDSAMNMKNGGQWAVNIINSLNSNIVGTKLQFKSSKNANELKTFIDGIELKKPLLTNIQEAMKKTLEEVNRLYALDSKKENVVLFIGDGAPSCTSYTNGNEGDNGTGYGTNQNYGFTTEQETENLITNYTNQIKQKAKIYTVGYELAGEDEWKQDISNKIIKNMSNGTGYFYNASASDLNTKLAKISTAISEENIENLTPDETTGQISIKLKENTGLEISSKTPVTLIIGTQTIKFNSTEEINTHFETTGILKYENNEFIINTCKTAKDANIKLTYYYK